MSEVLTEREALLKARGDLAIMALQDMADGIGRVLAQLAEHDKQAGFEVQDPKASLIATLRSSLPQYAGLTDDEFLTLLAAKQGDKS